MPGFENHVKDFVASNGGRDGLRRLVPKIDRGIDRAVSYGKSSLRLLGGARMLGTGATAVLGSGGLDPTGYQEAKTGLGEIKQSGKQLLGMYKKDEPASVRRARQKVQSGITKVGRRASKVLQKAIRPSGGRLDADPSGGKRRGMDPDQLARIAESIQAAG